MTLPKHVAKLLTVLHNAALLHPFDKGINVIKQETFVGESDWLIGFHAGCSDIEHSLPVRRFDGCSAMYIDGYAKGYTSAARRAMSQLFASARDIYTPEHHGDSLSEDDAADYALEQRSLEQHLQRMEREVMQQVAV